MPVDAVLAGMELDPYGCCGTSCNGGDEALRGTKTSDEALAAVRETAVTQESRDV